MRRKITSTNKKALLAYVVQKRLLILMIEERKLRCTCVCRMLNSLYRGVYRTLRPTKKIISSPLHLYLLLARDRAAVLHIRARLLAVHAAHGVVGGGGVHLVEAAAAEGALRVELGRVVRVLPTLKNGKIKKSFCSKTKQISFFGVKIMCLSTGLLQGLPSGSKKANIVYKCP